MKNNKKNYYQKISRNWFSLLQNIICYKIQELEKRYSKNNHAKFKILKFDKKKGWYQEHRIIHGNVFEKASVNFSEVSSKFDKKFAHEIPGTKKNNKFWASGISVVAHMKNPKIPSMHFNTRFICTQKSWFGGGMDLTPSYKNNNQKKRYHSKLKKMCDQHNKKYYVKYKKWCDTYFYLPHRKELRGIGGIFFDYHFNNFEKDIEFVKDVGKTFVDIMDNIVSEHIFSSWTKKEKEDQLIKRGRYVEFNLLYDRGTKFGLKTGGNVDAILMSMPPEVKWK